jgi:hypothetical protein
MPPFKLRPLCLKREPSFDSGLEISKEERTSLPKNKGHSVPGERSRADEENKGKANAGTTFGLLQKLNSGTKDGIQASDPYPMI